MKIFNTFEELAAPYCERQLQSPDVLRSILVRQKELYAPDGWALFEAADMCSSQLGRLRIVVYGPNNTYKTPPEGPVQFDGLASTTSVVIGLLPAGNLG